MTRPSFRGVSTTTTSRSPDTGLGYAENLGESEPLLREVPD